MQSDLYLLTCLQGRLRGELTGRDVREACLCVFGASDVDEHGDEQVDVSGPVRKRIEELARSLQLNIVSDAHVFAYRLRVVECEQGGRPGRQLPVASTKGFERGSSSKSDASKRCVCVCMRVHEPQRSP